LIDNIKRLLYCCNFKKITNSIE